MKTRRLGRFLAILFAVRGAERVDRQAGLPAGLLLHAVEGAQVIPPGANSPATRAQTGTLLFYGSRVLSGEHPVSFVLYPQKSRETVYTFSPLFGSLPLRNFDPKKRSAEYEVQIDPEGVIPHYGRLETRTDLPEPLLLPDPRLVARNPSAGPESLLIARIDAALRTVSMRVPGPAADLAGGGPRENQPGGRAAGVPARRRCVEGRILDHLAETSGTRASDPRRGA